MPLHNLFILEPQQLKDAVEWLKSYSESDDYSEYESQKLSDDDERNVYEIIVSAHQMCQKYLDSSEEVDDFEHYQKIFEFYSANTDITMARKDYDDKKFVEHLMWYFATAIIRYLVHIVQNASIRKSILSYFKDNMEVIVQSIKKINDDKKAGKIPFDQLMDGVRRGDKNASILVSCGMLDHYRSVFKPKDDSYPATLIELVDIMFHIFLCLHRDYGDDVFDNEKVLLLGKK